MPIAAVLDSNKNQYTEAVDQMREKINDAKKGEKITEKDKAFYRFLNLLNPREINHFIKNQNPLEIFEIKNNYKNLFSEYEEWIENSSELIPKLQY